MTARHAEVTGVELGRGVGGWVGGHQGNSLRPLALGVWPQEAEMTGPVPGSSPLSGSTQTESQPDTPALFSARGQWAGTWVCYLCGLSPSVC